jgi:hypothetical protein
MPAASAWVLKASKRSGESLIERAPWSVKFAKVIKAGILSLQEKLALACDADDGQMDW